MELCEHLNTLLAIIDLNVTILVVNFASLYCCINSIVTFACTIFQFYASLNWMHNMPGTTKEQTCEEGHREEDDERTLQSLKQELKPQNKVKSSLSKRKVTNCLRECNGNASSKKKSANQSLKNKIVSKAIVRKSKTSKKPTSLSNHKPRSVGTKDGENTDDADLKPQKLKRRRRKKRKNNVEHDEAARLQKRTRYLLMKMKQEQNLIDAYSAEGWKGQRYNEFPPTSF